MSNFILHDIPVAFLSKKQGVFQLFQPQNVGFFILGLSSCRQAHKHVRSLFIPYCEIHLDIISYLGSIFDLFSHPTSIFSAGFHADGIVVALFQKINVLLRFFSHQIARLPAAPVLPLPSSRKKHSCHGSAHFLHMSLQILPQQPS
jgi:hypothetical protein